MHYTFTIVTRYDCLFELLNYEKHIRCNGNGIYNNVFNRIGVFNDKNLKMNEQQFSNKTKRNKIHLTVNLLPQDFNVKRSATNGNSNNNDKNS